MQRAEDRATKTVAEHQESIHKDSDDDANHQQKNTLGATVQRRQQRQDDFEQNIYKARGWIWPPVGEDNQEHDRYERNKQNYPYTSHPMKNSNNNKSKNTNTTNQEPQQQQQEQRPSTTKIITSMTTMTMTPANTKNKSKTIPTSSSDTIAVECTAGYQDGTQDATNTDKHTTRTSNTCLPNSTKRATLGSSNKGERNTSKNPPQDDSTTTRQEILMKNNTDDDETTTTAAVVEVASVSSLLPAPSGIRIPTYEHAITVVDDANLIVGMHPDQAVDAIIDAALYKNISFFVVPCCTYSREFPNRRIPIRTTTDDGDERRPRRNNNEKKKNANPSEPPQQQQQQNVAEDDDKEMATAMTAMTKVVTTYDELIQYLENKSPDIKRHILPFEGRNICLYRVVPP